MNMPVFDNFADNYRDILKDSIKNLSEFDSEYFAEYKVQNIKDSLNTMPQNILDFGCGDGTSCKFLRKYFPDAAITGIDVSYESIKIAHDKQIQNCKFIPYEGDKIPFDSNSFDLIFVACVFHHIEKQKHFSIIKELNRILKKDGKLVIFEHNPFNPLTQKVVKDCAFDKDAELIYPKTLKKIIKQSNFHNPKINYTLFIPRYSIFEKIFFLEKYFKWCFLGAQYYLEALKIN